MGILLATLLITVLLTGSRFLLAMLFFPQAPGRRSLRRARHSLIARQAMQDIDRKYEQLLSR